ncbi:hypothetical protein AN958_05279 [Leucoagaricus sp. SymC.cos]|nr:hypothetical protein AN958_05279 [Leucoagaricus sp. SymC.cos]
MADADHDAQVLYAYEICLKHEETPATDSDALHHVYIPWKDDATSLADLGKTFEINDILPFRLFKSRTPQTSTPQSRSPFDWEAYWKKVKAEVAVAPMRRHMYAKNRVSRVTSTNSSLARASRRLSY